MECSRLVTVNNRCGFFVLFCFVLYLVRFLKTSDHIISFVIRRLESIFSGRRRQSTKLSMQRFLEFLSEKSSPFPSKKHPLPFKSSYRRSEGSAFTHHGPTIPLKAKPIIHTGEIKTTFLYYTKVNRLNDFPEKECASEKKASRTRSQKGSKVFSPV